MVWPHPHPQQQAISWCRSTSYPHIPWFHKVPREYIFNGKCAHLFVHDFFTIAVLLLRGASGKARIKFCRGTTFASAIIAASQIWQCLSYKWAIPVSSLSKQFWVFRRWIIVYYKNICNYTISESISYFPLHTSIDTSIHNQPSRSPTLFDGFLFLPESRETSLGIVYQNTRTQTAFNLWCLIIDQSRDIYIIDLNQPTPLKFNMVHLKISPGKKRRFLLKRSIFRFLVKLWGCNMGSFSNALPRYFLP